MTPPTHVIGLDFGTAFTKVCVFHRRSDIRRFISWENEAEPFLLPSQIHRLPDDTLRYGRRMGESAGKTFGLFKMAAAEDEEFRMATGFNPATRFVYDPVQYRPFTPELLSVLYLSFVLLEVRANFLKKQAEKPRTLAKIGGLLGMGTDREAEEITFGVNIGVPTECSKKVNQLRRQKFETMLCMAYELAEQFSTKEIYLRETATSLTSRVRKLLAEITHQNLAQKLERYRLRVYPESAAGIHFLTQTGKLPAGYHATLDIGGGSSDVAFFRYNPGGTPAVQYYGSDSVMLGTSNFYALLKGNISIDFVSIQEAEVWVRAQTPQEIEQNDDYLKAFRKFFALNLPGHPEVNLRTRIKRIFLAQVYRQFPKGDATRLFGRSQCLLFGGGAFLPWPNDSDLRSITLNDAGTISGPQNLIELRRIQDYTPTANIEPATLWKERFPILAVSLGLSFVLSENAYFWQEATTVLSPDKPTLVPHPANTDCYVYDVFKQRLKED